MSASLFRIIVNFVDDLFPANFPRYYAFSHTLQVDMIFLVVVPIKTMHWEQL